MSLFHLAKLFIQFLIVLFSMLMNLILIILVIHQSPKKIGNYKYLMCYFCVMSMIYAGIDYIVQPYIHSYGSSFSMIMDLRDSIFSKFRQVASVLTASLAACFGVSIYAIAINFIYRYLAIQREGRTRYFHGFRLYIWLTIPILTGILWLSVAWFLLDYDEELAEYLM
ncbi:hypothetical protein CRE_10748 [Caenorhabditis remanei]|uniref:G-protein coupled receptors family 1 profile domain-containing protein n=1 Tax=Caenorhabditis remanei TaxID=31234 RepID=E3NRK9_CAERE|nr:hypothetical protein CRE_10748 [Caenorhabditis remanei]